MPRTALVVLVITGIVVIGSTGLPAATTDSDTLNTGEDSAILLLGSPTTAEFTTQSLDIGATLTTQRDTAIGHLERYAFDAALRDASTEQAKRDRLRAAVDDVDRHVESLVAEEQRLRAAYVNGSVSTEAFIRGLTRNTARAQQLRDDIDRLTFRTTDIGGVGLRSRLETLDTTLIPFTGPVRSTATASVRGDEPSVRLYVDVSSNGIVLAAISDGVYVREAYRSDLRTTSRPTIGLDEAVALANNHYPVAFNNSLRTGVGFLQGSVYRIDIQLRDGSITAYLDGGSGDVFYEIHERRLQQVTDPTGATVTANSTRLIVNQSYMGGPLRVVTVDNTTGAGVAATVVIDGERFVTGNDGVLWTMVPPKAFFSITAVRSTGNTTVIIEPSKPRAVNR